MWVKSIAQFKSRDIEDIVWDDMSKIEQEENCEPREFRFDTNEIAAYNEARDGNTTTLRFKNGDDFTILMKVSELDKVIFKENS